MSADEGAAAVASSALNVVAQSQFLRDWAMFMVTIAVAAVGGFLFGKGFSAAPADRAWKPWRRGSSPPSARRRPILAELKADGDAAGGLADGEDGGDGGGITAGGGGAASGGDGGGGAGGRVDMEDDADDATEGPEKVDGSGPTPAAEDEEMSLDSSDDETDAAPPVRRIIVVHHQLPVRIERDGASWRVEWHSDSRQVVSNLRRLVDPLYNHDGGDDEGAEPASGVGGNGGGAAAERPFEITWVGWPGVDLPRGPDRDNLEEALAQVNCHPVWMRAEARRLFFHGFCKRVLWPLFHYVMPQGNAAFSGEWDELYRAYTSANMLFASEVGRLLENDSTAVLVQDYHLLLLATHLRKRRPRAKVGIFLHTPFPVSDVFRTLPARETILRGLLSCDLIGFHTFEFARHFLSSARRILGITYRTLAGGVLGLDYFGRPVSVHVSHVGVQADVFGAAARSARVLRRTAEIKARYAGRHIMTGFDSLDKVKGSLLKLQAYSLFLEENPAWRDRVVLVEVITPSLNSKAERADVRAEIMREVERIRARFGAAVLDVVESSVVCGGGGGGGGEKADARPGVERYAYTSGNTMDIGEAVSLYLASSATVLSTFWDGLNVVPYELSCSFAADAERPAALVVSEFIGCSRAVSGAIVVNPWSIRQVSEAMATALSMPDEERRMYHRQRHQHATSWTLMRWAVGFLNDLDRAWSMTKDLKFVSVGWGSNATLVGMRGDFTLLTPELLIPAYRKSSARLLLLDYDGTLSSETDAVLSRPSEALLASLSRLASAPGTHVFILSGRSRATLGEWFRDCPAIGLCAEKGFFIRWPGHAAAGGGGGAGACGQEGEGGAAAAGVGPGWTSAIRVGSMEWKELAADVMRIYAERTSGAYIEDKEAGLVWHYERTDPEFGALQAKELTKYLQGLLQSHKNLDIVEYQYSRIVEVKAKGAGKGQAVRRILRRVLQSSGGPSASLSPLASPASSPPLGPRPEGGKPDAPFVLCVGDDRSDEEMFSVLQHSRYTDTDPCTVDHPSSASAAEERAARLTPSGSERMMEHVRRANDRNGWVSVRRSKGKDGIRLSGRTFTVCVGFKPSRAHYYLHDSAGATDMLEQLAHAAEHEQKRNA